MSMNRHRVLRVLHLEDNPMDRHLIHERLRDAGLHCEFRLAVCRDEFSAALMEESFDLIISDFTLPAYNGAQALAAAQERQPDVPFIFVSGTIGEDRAVESLKSGATDYVLKNHLDRLGPAVHRALRLAEERQLRHKAEAALRRNEELLREMSETIRDVFWSADADGRLLYVSPAFEQIWGMPLEELQQQPDGWLAMIHPDDLPKVRDALARLAEGVEYQIEYRINPRGGKGERCIDDRGYPIRDENGRVVRAVGVATDVTRRKFLESQLLQAQKMEAIGQLAGGIAHDFNNTLTVINGYTRLVLDLEKTLSPETMSRIQSVYAAGMRAGNLTRQLLLFSRKHAINKQVIDLNEHIRELAKMLGRIIGEHIRLELQLGPGLPAVNADAGMMEQVLMNLAVNARDAMPKGGLLTITSSPRHFTADDVAANANRRTGEFVCLAVTDTGVGIPPENLARIFEPFFTTKPAGQGTGLGLATVHGIAVEHEGWIEVESVVGQGTTIRMLLPATPERPESGRRSAEPFLRKGSETILLVEDETPVREFAVAVLDYYGYRVLQAASGLQALETWKWHRERIALLLTDMVMPDGVSGIELAEKLQAEKPNLPVVLMSGYTSESIGQLYTKRRLTRFLQKPFQPGALSRAIRESLDESAS